MPTETEFEPRYSQSVLIQTPCNADECECPPSLVTWVGIKCPKYIIGTVRDARTLEPLQNISVWVESFETDSFGQATTNGLGHFRINDLEAGKGYILTASGPGYSYRVLEDGVLPEEGLVQDVQLFRTGALKGKVTDVETGEPIAGAIVSATQAPADYARLIEIETDEEGNYLSCDVDATPEGLPYILMANAEGHSEDFGAEVTIVSKEQGSPPPVERNLALAGLGSVTGTVIGSVVGPIEGALVRVASSETFSIEYWEVETDEAGAFAIFGLPVNDQYNAYVDAPYHEPRSLEVDLSSSQPTLSLLVQTNFTEWIEGVVRDASTGLPISGATLQAQKQVDEFWSFTGNDGHFVMDRVAGAGTYTITTMATGYLDSIPTVVQVSSGGGTVTNIELERSE